MKPLGWVEVKREGERIKFDRDGAEPKEEKFWFEHRFTKAQFAQLSAMLQNSGVDWVDELAQDFQERSINGYGR